MTSYCKRCLRLEDIDLEWKAMHYLTKDATEEIAAEGGQVIRGRLACGHFSRYVGSLHRKLLVAS